MSARIWIKRPELIHEFSFFLNHVLWFSEGVAPTTKHYRWSHQGLETHITQRIPGMVESAFIKRKKQTQM